MESVPMRTRAPRWSTAVSVAPAEATDASAAENARRPTRRRKEQNLPGSPSCGDPTKRPYELGSYGRLTHRDGTGSIALRPEWPLISSTMAPYEGKRGLVLGVANRRSIAWAIAKRLADGGA